MPKSQAPITNYLPEKLQGLRIEFAVLFFFVPNESQMASGTGLVRDSLAPPSHPCVFVDGFQLRTIGVSQW